MSSARTTSQPAQRPRTELRDYLKQVIYGGNDGIVTTFAVVAGFAGAGGGDPTSLGVTAVVLFGLANLFGDATSMGLGDYVSELSERDLARRAGRESLARLGAEPQAREADARRLLERHDFTSDQAQQLAALLATNKPFWNDILLRYEQDLSLAQGKSAVTQSLVTFFSFIVFGFIPLVPYILFADALENLFAFAAFGALGSLLLLGLLNWRVSGAGFVRSLSEIVVTGVVASGVAYLVGSFFEL